MEKCILWTDFMFTAHDWEIVNDMRAIIADANNIQQYFSSKQHPTLWHAIPALEKLQTAWESKKADPKYRRYRAAIKNGLAKIGKYYTKLDEKPVYILALGTFISHIFLQFTINN